MAATPDRLRPFLGPALRRLREQRRLRQNEAAAAAGITKAMLSAYETGRRLPALRTLQAVLVALKADFRHLDEALRWVREEAARKKAS
jgi:transcriptional regulator with XRE-family HTH domain